MVNFSFKTFMEGLTKSKLFSKFKVMTLNQFLNQSITNEDRIPLPTIDDSPEESQDQGPDMLGAKTKKVPPEEMHALLQRIITRKKKRLGELPKVQMSREDKKAAAAAERQQYLQDRYKMPIIHASNIKIIDDRNNLYDLDALRALISTRPIGPLLKRNSKIQHSGGELVQYYNIGLPALKGLVIDEATGDFLVVDTCPGAASCQIYCFARKGGYVQWKSSSLSQSRILNFLLNDPEGFKNRLNTELAEAKEKAANKNIKVALRWHDAGDFFSPSYWDLAKEVAKENPDIYFYAYTKMANVANTPKPNNFIINFSSGAKNAEEQNIDFELNKHAIVVPYEIFTDLANRISSKKIAFTPKNMKELKNRISTKYNIRNDKTLITYDELKEKSYKADASPIYNVIVKPGDGDDAANRNDVLGTYLLQH